MKVYRLRKKSNRLLATWNSEGNGGGNFLIVVILVPTIEVLSATTLHLISKCARG